jgi:hypothetical protein
VEAGLIVAIVVGAIGAVVAIGIGIAQIHAARERPNPHFKLKSAAVGGGATLPVVLINTGGAAPRCHALAHAGLDFYEFRGGVPAQANRQDVEMMRLGYEAARTESDVPFVVWTIAEDGKGKWWDVMRRRHISEPINEWLKQRSDTAGLQIPVEIVGAGTTR